MRRMSYAVTGLLVVGIAATVFCLYRYQASMRPASKVAAQPKSSGVAAKNSNKPSAPASSGGSPADHPSTGKSTNGTAPTPSPSAPNGTSACANIFSISEAQQVLGSSLAADANTNSVSQTSDTVTTTCGYHTSTRTAQIVAHIAKTSGGSSSNIVEFGSGRPSNVTTVNGHGSAAFWQPDTGELSILSDNNWFTVSGTDQGTDQGTSSLSYAEQIATAAKL